MKLRYKKQKTTGRAPQTVGRSTPIIRYHRPADSIRQNTTTETRAKESNQQKRDIKIRSVLKGMFRYSGVAAIIVIVLANTTVSSATLKVTGDRDSYQSLDTYNNEINNMFNRSVFSSSKFLINSAKLESEIKDKFPEVVASSVIIPLAGRQLQVNLEFAKPMMRLLQLDNQQGIITENGTLSMIEDAEKINEQFSELPSLSLPSVKSQQGSQVLTSDEVDLLALLIKEFDGSDRYRSKLVSVEYEIAKREIRARFSGQSYFVKMTPERNHRSQVGALLAIQKELTEKGGLPQEYIDVRVDDRVYVK